MLSNWFAEAPTWKRSGETENGSETAHNPTPRLPFRPTTRHVAVLTLQRGNDLDLIYSKKDQLLKACI